MLHTVAIVIWYAMQHDLDHKDFGHISPLSNIDGVNIKLKTIRTNDHYLQDLRILLHLGYDSALEKKGPILSPSA